MTSIPPKRLTFAVYVILCWAYFPVVFALYPETSSRTLEDMDQIFIQSPSIFVFGKRDMTQRERPQAFIDAETQRIAEAEDTQLGKDVRMGKTGMSTEVERV